LDDLPDIPDGRSFAGGEHSAMSPVQRALQPKPTGNIMTTLSTILRAALPLAAATFAAAVSASAAVAADFQQYLQGNCNGLVCTVDFDKVPAGKTLRVKQTSCYIRGNHPSDPYGLLRAVQLLVVKGNSTVGMAVSTPTMVMGINYGATDVQVVYQSNDEVQVTAKGGQHLRSHVEIFKGSFEQVACHISGTLS
jgi:hypothetical protein